MITYDLDVGDWVALVRAEFLEMPGLRLTRTQAQRLWGLDDQTCDTVLHTLVSTGFLSCDNNVYVRRDAIWRAGVAVAAG